MILEIKKYGNPVLKQKAKEVKEITPAVKELILNMKETLDAAQGVGLAAPQIGVSERIIIIKAEKTPSVLINPRIVKRSSQKEIGEEGCLCFPGIFLKIKRAKEVEAQALSERGDLLRITATGLTARVLQHEVDHLNGILIIDRIPFWQRWKLLKR